MGAWSFMTFPNAGGRGFVRQPAGGKGAAAADGAATVVADVRIQGIDSYVPSGAQFGTITGMPSPGALIDASRLSRTAASCGIGCQRRSI